MLPLMTSDEIQRALADISAETDPTLKHLKLASLVSAIFRERGIELIVVGGSAIEFFTEGAYVSGDLDLCLVSPPRLDIRTRQELMGELGARGGPRTGRSRDNTWTFSARSKRWRARPSLNSRLPSGRCGW